MINSILIIVFAVTAAIFDIKSRIIPNILVLSMLGVWLLLLAFDLVAGTDLVHANLLDGLIGALAGGGIFLTVYIISRKGLGGGDVKFMAAAGLYLGLAGTLPAILFGSILAGLFGAVLILSGKITRKDKVPLAPFLLAGIVITILI